MTPIPRRALAASLAWLGAVSAARAQAVSDVAAPIAALDQALLSAMQAGRSAPFPQRAATIGPAVDRAFNLPAVLQASVGLAWSNLPPGQQQALLAAFRDYTVATWTSNFDTYDGQRFEIAPQLRSVGADQVVQTRIIPRSGDPTRLDYVMRRFPAGWQAVDVLVDGSISRVATQRSDFRSLLTGGDASRLIANLQQKVSSLSGGTMR